MSSMTFDMKSPQLRPRIIPFGVTTGAAQVETLTVPSTAAATQADFVVIYNQAGASEALWLDIDADGTAPTAAEFLAATVQTMVSISTGDSAADNAAILYAASAAIGGGSVIGVDNLNGTITLTQDIYGACENGVPYNADGSGAGSFLISVGTEGLNASLGAGKFDGQVEQTEIGVYIVSFNLPFLRVPEVGVSMKSDNRVARVSASAVGSVTIEVSNLVGGATANGNFSLIVLGSDYADAI
jgi:hypothetical protein